MENPQRWNSENIASHNYLSNECGENGQPATQSAPRAHFLYKQICLGRSLYALEELLETLVSLFEYISVISIARLKTPNQIQTKSLGEYYNC